MVQNFLLKYYLIYKILSKVPNNFKQVVVTQSNSIKLTSNGLSQSLVSTLLTVKHVLHFKMVKILLWAVWYVTLEKELVFVCLQATITRTKIEITFNQWCYELVYFKPFVRNLILNLLLCRKICVAVLFLLKKYYLHN